MLGPHAFIALVLGLNEVMEEKCKWQLATQIWVLGSAVWHLEQGAVLIPTSDLTLCVPLAFHA